MVTPQKRMTYAQWLEKTQRERAARAEAVHAPAHVAAGVGSAGSVVCVEPVCVEAACVERVCVEPIEEAQITGGECDAAVPADQISVDGPTDEAVASRIKVDPAALPAVEYFRAGQAFSIGEIEVHPFTIPHDAADPCGFVFHARQESIRMAVATDLGYVPPNVKLALRNVDVLLLESNHDLEMLKDGPYPWSVKQRVLSRVGHLSNTAAAEFLLRDYDGGAHTIVLGHLSEQNNLPELARLAAEQAIGDRLSLLGNRVVLAAQDAPLAPISL
jgi:ribonuclease BN (tRNA processing enzyme)